MLPHSHTISSTYNCNLPAECDNVLDRNEYVMGRMHAFEMIPLLRERDGDTCWLCGEPIDFDLPKNDPMAVSRDHIKRKRDGGPWFMENIRLAHRKCNQERD